ncbi:MAG TPA: DNA primase [Spirochaetia bacterium]|nr:DNA primase [Spirochaetales bacterium]HRS64288.1 DNA primase [Spirochaetia bacterium]HRV27579.1 DNA primase [Spirochaetia bacterium]
MSKRIPEEFIQQLISDADIVDIISDYVSLSRRGSRYVGLCPFHHEKTPSFSVQQDKNFFYCFGCKKGGDVITFLKEIEHCDYIDAIQILAKKLNRTIPYEQSSGMNAEDEHENHNSLYEIYARLTETFNYCLHKTNEGLQAYNYLIQRGLTPELIDKFKLGYAPAQRNWLYNKLKSKSYSPDFLKQTGLFSKTYPDISIFSGRVMFPIFNRLGNVVAFGARLLSGTGPKYINSPETAIYHKSKVLYGLHQSLQTIKETGSVIIVEGYMDVLAWHQVGVTNAVAPLGTSLTEDHVRMLSKLAKEIILNFDADRAGKQATNRAIELLLAHNCTIKVLSNKDSKDAAEILQKNGPEDLQNLLKFSITIQEYIMEELYSLKTSSFESALSLLFSFMLAAGTHVQRDQLAQIGAQVLNVEKQALLADYQKGNLLHKPTVRSDNLSVVSAKQQIAPEVKADLILLAQLASDVEQFKFARSEIHPIDFENEHVRSIFIVLEELFRKDTFTIPALLHEVEGNPLKDIFIEYITKNVFPENIRQVIGDAINNKKIRVLERQRAEITRKINEFQKNTNVLDYSINDLLCEQMFLTNEIKRLREKQS